MKAEAMDIVKNKFPTKLTQKQLKKYHKKKKLLKKLKLAEEHSRKTNEQLTEKVDDAVNSASNTIPTLSIAVPGSILENAQSAELRTYLAGQIARAACIFRVNEVVVFDDLGPASNQDLSNDQPAMRHSCLHLARILQYLECPQYLRKHFFPVHQDLQYSGLLNPLDCPHHLRLGDKFPFREGVVINQPTKPGHSNVYVGLATPVTVERALMPGLRVTVRIPKDSKRKARAEVVAPSLPSQETGTYWGYEVRLASSLSAVFSQSPFPGGYDLTIGTSDKGANVNQFSLPQERAAEHTLVVFGGLQGLEPAVECDPLLSVDEPGLLFDYYLNTCPRQGSRTIRTEEAILVSLAALQEKLRLDPGQNTDTTSHATVSETDLEVPEASSK